MASEGTEHAWPRRPTPSTAWLVATALAALCTLAGWWITVAERSLFWFLGLFLVSIWVLLVAGPWVVRALEGAGVFGRVRKDGASLDAGRGTRTVRLAEPFRLSVQRADVDASYEIRLDQMGVSRTRKRRTESRFVRMLLARFEQAESRLLLVADDVSTSPGPAWDLQGISYHRSPLGRPDGPVVRMRPQDLADLLRETKLAAGCDMVAPPAAEPLDGDPRPAFWRTWKTVVGVLVVLAVGILAAAWRLEHAPAPPAPPPVPRGLPEQPDTREPQDPRAEALLGKRVFVYAEQGVKLYGPVERYEVRDGVGDTASRTVLTVLIDALKDALYRPLPPEARVPYGPDGAEVGVGSRVEVGLDQATEIPSGSDD